MKALRLEDDGLVLVDSPIPTPSAEEALVKVNVAGICSTDLELVKGYYQFRGILGHEFVGQVSECAQREWVGKRVVSSINFVDKDFDAFAEFGLEHHPDRTVLGIVNRDGVFAEYVTIPIANLFEVPPAVVDRAAVFAEPLAAALRITQQIRVDANWRIAVLGPGKLGMLIGKVLSLQGADVTLLGRRTTSLELAQSWGLKTMQSDQCDSSSFHAVVDATGHPAGLSTAIDLTRPLGTIVLKSTFHGAQQIDLTKVVVDEIKIVGSRCGPFRPALRLLAGGAVNVESLIDAEYSLSDALTAMEHAAQSGVRKVLLST